MDDIRKIQDFTDGFDPDDINPADIDVERNISDFAGIIESSYVDKIDKVINKIERKTSVEIAVVTVDSLKGKSIDDTAFKLFNKFGVGKKEENNGVLFLISRDDNQYRIELGLGLEDIIDDDLQRKLINNLISPNFKNRRFGKPILKFVRVIYDRIRGGKTGTLSLISWLAGIVSLVFGAAGVLLSAVITLKYYTDMDIYSTTQVASLFVKTASPAAVLALVAIISGMIDMIRIKAGLTIKRLILKSIWGIIFGVLALALVSVIFFIFPHFILFLARIFSLATGIY